MSNSLQQKPAPMVVRKVDNVQIVKEYSDQKVRRTLASICGFTVNTYMMYIFKAAEGVSSESQLFFHLLALVMLVVTIREKDASYLFSAFAVFFTPYIVLAAGLSIYSIASILVAITVLGFQRGVTMQNLASGAIGLADSLGQSNTRRKILKLAQSDVEAENLLEEDLTEFKEVEVELQKVKKSYDNCKPAMKSALKATINEIEQLQLKHATVLARSAGLSAFLKTVDTGKIQKEIAELNQQKEKCSDDVLKEQLQQTIEMKNKRIMDLDRLDTSLNRVKMQKLQMREMFNSLMDKMNTFKFTDIITLQASSDAMVHDVKIITNSLVDLEKGLIEAENISRNR